MPVAGGDARTTAGKDAGATAYRITRPQHSMLPEIHTLKLRSAVLGSHVSESRRGAPGVLDEPALHLGAGGVVD